MNGLAASIAEEKIFLCAHIFQYLHLHLQLLPAGHSANPRPNLALRAAVRHRPVRLLLPLTRLKAKRADLRFEPETARVLTL